VGDPYRVSFPDFPNVVATGDTLDDARRDAELTLFLQVRNLVADGRAIPEPLRAVSNHLGPKDQQLL
jgi:predicted RNase H-like HicB family nuclease